MHSFIPNECLAVTRAAAGQLASRTLDFIEPSYPSIQVPETFLELPPYQGALTRQNDLIFPGVSSFYEKKRPQTFPKRVFFLSQNQ